MHLSDLAAESLNRALRASAATPVETARIRLGLFSRRAGRLVGIQDVLDLARRRAGAGVTVRARMESDEFNPGEIVLTIEGPFGAIASLPTECAGLLSLSAGAAAMGELVEVAGGLPLIDLSAGAFPPELTPRIALAAAVGGASATASRSGHAEVHARFGIGGGQIRIGPRPPAPFTLHEPVPAVLHAAAGAVVEGAVLWHNRFPPQPMTVELDAPAAERDAVSALVQRFHSNLHAVQLVLPADRLVQGGHDRPQRALEMRILSQAADRRAAQAALDRIGFGPGLSVEAVYSVRDLLDSLSARMTKIIIAGDVDADRIRDLKACKAPIDSIAATSWVRFAPFEAVVTDVWENDRWRSLPDDHHGGRVIPDQWPIQLET